MVLLFALHVLSDVQFAVTVLYNIYTSVIVATVYHNCYNYCQGHGTIEGPHEILTLLPHRHRLCMHHTIMGRIVYNIRAVVYDGSTKKKKNHFNFTGSDRVLVLLILLIYLSGEKKKRGYVNTCLKFIRIFILRVKVSICEISLFHCLTNM